MHRGVNGPSKNERFREEKFPGRCGEEPTDHYREDWGSLLAVTYRETLLCLKIRRIKSTGAK
jgi:hypothetical protein